MIVVENLRKRYGQLQAVDGVSLRVESGEALGFLGPNGAGKSTTIHMIAGLLKPDEGSVEIDGQSDPTRAAVRARLGVVPQALAIYEEMTGEENVLFFGKLYGVRGAQLKERAAWALDFVGLSDRKNDPAKNYSGGMKRRLNIACALLHDPPALLFDEPTVGVDPQSRNAIFDNILALKERGKTIIYTTHYMEEAERLCDRVAIVDRGKVLAIDTVDGLVHENGGPAVVSAEFEEPPADGALPWKLEEGGRKLRLESAKPLDEVAKLAGAGVAVKSLSVERPSLEAVFLNLTGRSLRDD